MIYGCDRLLETTTTRLEYLLRMVNWKVESANLDATEVESTDFRNTDPHSEINPNNTTVGASKIIGIFP